LIVVSSVGADDHAPELENGETRSLYPVSIPELIVGNNLIEVDVTATPIG